MSQLNIVNLGASSASNGLATWQATAPVTSEQDVEDFGNLEVYQCLGVISRPYPADANGKAQAIVAPGLGSADGAVIGARDTRATKGVGNVEPGDTFVTSTDPDQSAMVGCKGSKKKTFLACKGSDSKNMLVLLDGKNNKVQITAFGQMFELSKQDGITITDGSAASIRIKDGKVCILGTLVLGGMTPVGPVAWSLTPVVGVTGSTIPAAGVFIGV